MHKRSSSQAALAHLTISSGNTLTDNFLKDVGITQFQYNVGQQLLSLGIVLLEVSSYRHRAETHCEHVLTGADP